MTRSSLIVSIGLTMLVPATYAQSLFSARSLALGAYGAFVNDSRSFESNPAGLVTMRDWEFSTSTYSATSSGGFVFQGLTLGKRFLDDEAVSVAYMPGALLEFSLPAIVVNTDSGAPASIQQRISYQENFLVAFAHRVSPVLSMGVTGRFRQSKVNDTKYELVQQGGIYVSRITPRTEQASLSVVDVGALFTPMPELRLGVVGRNLLAVREELPSDLRAFTLPATRFAEVSARLSPTPSINLAVQVSTLQSGAFGVEILPGAELALRAGMYVDRDETPSLFAWSVGAGWRYEFLEVDAGYLRFINRKTHSGTAALTSFDATHLNALDLHPYTTDRAMLTVKAIFGNIRSALVRIQSVEILSGVYPSSYELFAFRPIGRVMVKNVSDKPVQARARFFVERFMDVPTETQPVALAPGEEKEIPLLAVLNDQVTTVSKLTVREATVYVSATASEEYDDRVQTKVLIHGRNDWDGDVHSLRHFVTPDDPEVLRYTRDVLVEMKDSLEGVPQSLAPMRKAQVLFNAFAGKLVYVGDPKLSNDFVQYPSETLRLQSGDCDDMTVCFASLLSSIGISTAFIDVVPPQAPEKSHIYLMFDTGVEPHLGHLISDNPKRYVVRRNPRGIETIWLPIETTVITKGFEHAWQVGAQEYLQDVEINLGLVKGWVKIVDVN
jgi:hypothetical protein